ncbi:MAG: Fic family protein [Conexibacter sp.]
MEKLTIEDLLLIAEAVLGISAERLARAAQLGAAASALAAPFAADGDGDRHPELGTKAAILCSRLVRNHPLPDGNKRVALLAMLELVARKTVSGDHRSAGRTKSPPRSSAWPRASSPKRPSPLGCEHG